MEINSHWGCVIFSLFHSSCNPLFLIFQNATEAHFMKLQSIYDGDKLLLERENLLKLWICIALVILVKMKNAWNWYTNNIVFWPYLLRKVPGTADGFNYTLPLCEKRKKKKKKKVCLHLAIIHLGISRSSLLKYIEKMSQMISLRDKSWIPLQPGKSSNQGPEKGSPVVLASMLSDFLTLFQYNFFSPASKLRSQILCPSTCGFLPNSVSS